MSNLAPETDAQDAAAQRRAARLRATQTLTRIGLKFAEALEEDLDALNDAPATVAPGDTASQSKRELARACAQVSRAVSLAIALEERLDQDPEVRRLEAEARAARAKAEAARAEQARAEAALPRRKHEVEATLRRAVADAAPFGSQRSHDLERALNDALDRELITLDRFLDAPAEETIARIARGLGLVVERSDPTPNPIKDRHSRAKGAKATPRVRPSAGPRAGSDPGTQPGALDASPEADRARWRPAPLKSAHPRESGDPGFFVHGPHKPHGRPRGPPPP